MSNRAIKTQNQKRYPQNSWKPILRIQCLMWPAFLVSVQQSDALLSRFVFPPIFAAVRDIFRAYDRLG